ncbi:MAG: hypothetical protein GTO55_04040, partial [Armatimonadetes bacterium]|nr:hypothetical protein [Armatimonadota bacterium]NIM23443.1 hypothetical protein [Armatimonadota bacterium]NIM67308.1 hypothetical protein [Armatimonadota bacterium]NIM75806.1 hypothetical protein [Armatimonadota bacterium]NIN05494.1 hypothetical protein [Armatimonadota bacterium]
MCAACHAEPAAQWAATPHRRTFGSPHVPEEWQGCSG